MKRRKPQSLPIDVKAIPGFKGYFATKDGRIWSSLTHRWLAQTPKNKHGHLTVGLQIDFDKQKRVNSHRLILETFVGQCSEGMECRHLNGNPADNRLENLRWDTHRNNVKDAVKHGTHVNNSGENCGTSKLTEKDVRMIIYMWRTGLFLQKEIAKLYNISKSQIGLIINKKAWKHIWS